MKKGCLLLALGVSILLGCEKPNNDIPVAVQAHPDDNGALISLEDPNTILENLYVLDGELQVGAPPFTNSAENVPVILEPVQIQFQPNGSTFPLRMVFTDDFSVGEAAFVNLWIHGGNGFIQIPMNEDNTQLHVFETAVTLPDDIEQGKFTISYSITDTEGNSSIAHSFDVYIDYVGHGDLLVSLSWEGSVDLDLELVEPDGRVLNFSQRESPSGGKFNLDDQQGFHPETIVYENEPPNGKYLVRVNFYSRPGEDPILNYVSFFLTLQIDGTPVTFRQIIDKGESLNVLEFQKNDTYSYQILER